MSTGYRRPAATRSSPRCWRSWGRKAGNAAEPGGGGGNLREARSRRGCSGCPGGAAGRCCSYAAGRPGAGPDRLGGMSRGCKNMKIVNEVRKGFYLDSVALMRLSRAIAGLPGVHEAALMMGSPSNREILEGAGLIGSEGVEAGGNDLIIAITVEDEAAGEAALKEALARLDGPRSEASEGQERRPRSIRAAVSAMPDANLAPIAVPAD